MTEPQVTNPVVTLINERIAHWVAKGYEGADVYDQLASDTALPESFRPEVAAIVLNMQEASLAKRRKRKQSPSFRRIGPTKIDYPRHSFFHYLRDSFVERRPVLASSTYTQTA